MYLVSNLSAIPVSANFRAGVAHVFQIAARPSGSALSGPACGMDHASMDRAPSTAHAQPGTANATSLPRRTRPRTAPPGGLSLATAQADEYTVHRIAHSAPHHQAPPGHPLVSDPKPVARTP